MTPLDGNGLRYPADREGAAFHAMERHPDLDPPRLSELAKHRVVAAFVADGGASSPRAILPSRAHLH